MKTDLNMLKEFLSKAARHNIDPRVVEQVQNAINDIIQLDQEVKQKTFEVLNREQLLAQRDQLLVQKDSVINQKIVELQSTKQVLLQKDQVIAQKEQNLEQLKKNGGMGVREEFIYLLNKLYPDAYSADFKDWTDNLPMKKHVVNNNIQVMEKNIKIYKKLLEEKEQEDIKKEFIKSLNELYPDTYSTDPNEWFYKDGKPLPMKVHYDNNNFYVMVKNTLYYKEEIKKNKVKELEEAKNLREENLNLKALLAQKEEELLEKSFIKNLAIDELRENLDLKDDENEILKELISDLSFIDTSCQAGGNEIGSQVNEVEIDLIGVAGGYPFH